MQLLINGNNIFFKYSFFQKKDNWQQKQMYFEKYVYFV